MNFYNIKKIKAQEDSQSASVFIHIIQHVIKFINRRLYLVLYVFSLFCHIFVRIQPHCVWTVVLMWFLCVCDVLIVTAGGPLPSLSSQIGVFWEEEPNAHKPPNTSGSHHVPSLTPCLSTPPPLLLLPLNSLLHLFYVHVKVSQWRMRWCVRACVCVCDKCVRTWK